MPRRSPFVTQLTEPERAELEARCKVYTSPHRDVIRAKIVLLASRWRQRFYVHRLPGLEDRPRGGRPARFPPQCGGCDQGAGL